MRVSFPFSFLCERILLYVLEMRCDAGICGGLLRYYLRFGIPETSRGELILLYDSLIVFVFVFRGSTGVGRVTLCDA